MSPGIVARLPLPSVLLAFLITAPSPATRVDVAAWRADIDFIVDKLKSTHPNPWFRIGEDEFVAHAARLKADIPALDEQAITVQAMQLVALVQDGHTMLRPVNHPAFRHWFPVRSTGSPTASSSRPSTCSMLS